MKKGNHNTNMVQTLKKCKNSGHNVNVGACVLWEHNTVMYCTYNSCCCLQIIQGHLYSWPSLGRGVQHAWWNCIYQRLKEECESQV